MSHPLPPEPCLFFCGFIYNDTAAYEELLRTKVVEWGQILEISGSYVFNWSDYYEAEQGSGLMRSFACFSPLLKDPAELRERKLRAYQIEQEFSNEGKRRINLDPGYLNNHQLIVATFKPFAHRIALGDGVHAHLEYLFKRGAPAILPWTYPDFRTPEYQELFTGWRALYKRMKEEG
jgi:hypothetical protein